MHPVNTPKPEVAVEYDCRGKRVSKTFKCCFAARRFYVAKSKANRNPAVKAAQSGRAL